MTVTLLNLPPGQEFQDVTVIGRARHGKDTVANMLRVLDERFQRVAFADELKLHVADMLARSVKELDFNTPATSRMTREHFLSEFRNNKDQYRAVLQWFGTEFVRNIDDAYWIKTLNSQRRPPGVRFVLTDARFPNELDSQISNGSFVLKVVRTGVEIAESSHESESHVDELPYHILIKNDSSLDELFSQVRSVHDAYLKVS